MNAEELREQFENETGLSFKDIPINGVHLEYIEYLESKLQPFQGNAEEYLKKECYASDRTMDQSIQDMLWTKNVLKYMEEYAQSKLQPLTEAEIRKRAEETYPDTGINQLDGLQEIQRLAYIKGATDNKPKINEISQ